MEISSIVIRIGLRLVQVLIFEKGDDSVIRCFTYAQLCSTSFVHRLFGSTREDRQSKRYYLVFLSTLNGSLSYL